jgi:uncharacterized Ntn-hydrolase superfamily protein
MRHSFFAASLLVLASASTLRGQALRDQAPPTLSTFSIVACDPTDGFLGVAVQSRVVGAGSIVPAAEAGVGAVASQASANVSYKPRALALLRQGRSPEQVRAEFVRTDSGITRRQFAVMDAKCTVAAHTGDSTSAWAGHKVGRHYSAQGNILAGPEVVEAMGRAFEEAEAEGRPFGERLLAALKAAQAAGGDRRGRQGAGLLIVKAGGGYGGADDRYADLRVEDAVEPILELERVYKVWMTAFHPLDHYLPNGAEPFAAPAGPHVCALQALLARAGYGNAPAQARGSCGLDEDVLRALHAFQRANDLPVVPALTPAAAAKLRALASQRASGTR